MNQTEVRKLVSDVPAGTRLRFTYKREETGVLSYLVGLINSGIITADNPDAVKSLCIAINASGDWERDENRTFEVLTTDQFDVDWFVQRVGREVESFEVLT